MLNHNLVLKRDELFLAGEIAHSDESAMGLYLRDTRHLNDFNTTLGGEPLQILAAYELDADDAVVYAGNSLIDWEGVRLTPLRLGVQERIRLTDRLDVTFAIQNYTSDRVRLPLVISWSADFRDLFDIRGFRRRNRGVIQMPRRLADGVELAYLGLDGRTVATHVTWDHPADVKITPPGIVSKSPEPILLPGLEAVAIEDAPPPQAPGRVEATFTVDIEPGAEWSLRVTVRPIPVDSRPVADRSGKTTFAAAC